MKDLKDPEDLALLEVLENLPERVKLRTLDALGSAESRERAAFDGEGSIDRTGDGQVVMTIADEDG